MNLRRIAQSVSAIMLAVGLLSVSAPADATGSKPPTHTTNDTGWGWMR